MRIGIEKQKKKTIMYFISNKKKKQGRKNDCLRQSDHHKLQCIIPRVRGHSGESKEITECQA